MDLKARKFTVRPFRKEDAEAVKKLYSARPKCGFLDPDDLNNAAALVALNGEGEIIAYMVGRPLLEVHLVVNDEWGSPFDRLAAIMGMAKEGAELADKSGIYELTFGTPHPYEKWGNRLNKMKGIYRDDDRPRFMIFVKEFLTNWAGR